jgi:hypothetical protein
MYVTILVFKDLIPISCSYDISTSGQLALMAGCLLFDVGSIDIKGKFGID